MALITCNQSILLVKSLTQFQALLFLIKSNLRIQVMEIYWCKNIAKLYKIKKLHLFIESNSSILSYNAFKQLKSCHNLKALQIETTRLTTDSIKAISRLLPQLMLELMAIQINVFHGFNTSNI